MRSVATFADKVCDHCGEQFSKHPAKGRRHWEAQRFCGRRCASFGQPPRKLCGCGCGGHAESAGAYIVGHELMGANGRLHPSLVNRFLARIRVDEGGCWAWTGYATGNGYSQIKFGGRNGKGWLGHRIAYILWHGYEPPSSTDIDHLCRNRRCVNPEHLEAVTRRENARRGLKGVLKTHCVHGHPLNEANTGYTTPGHRYCLVCRKLRDARRGGRARVAA